MNNTKLANISELKKLHPAEEKRFNELIKKLIANHLIGSTLVEGSTFTEEEAKEVLSGESVYGHPIDEHLELTNGKQAASFIHRIFFQRDRITPQTIDRLHQILFYGIEDSSKKHPGKNRGETNMAAFTVILDKGKPVRISYEHPKIIRDEYEQYLDYYLNSPLPTNDKETLERIAKLYFQFQMLHPYSDGNGRIGRFLVSAKIAAEKGWFFRFELKDGPEHLRTMMEMTLHYKNNKKKISYQKLISFFDEHFER